jgi:hypothetical protein
LETKNSKEISSESVTVINPVNHHNTDYRNSDNCERSKNKNMPAHPDQYTGKFI